MKPLTIEQLKALEVNDWVWYVDLRDKNSFYVKKNVNIPSSLCMFLGRNTDFSDYGIKWLAYKNKEQAEAKGEIYCSMCQDDTFDEYVPVSPEGDICEKSCAPGEEWVYHANYCPNCGRRLISTEAERRLAELKGGEENG